MKTENSEKTHNIVIPFNIPGKPDIGIFDLNKIFTINFDSLKSLLEGLIASYRKTEEELENLKIANKLKNERINDLEQKMINLNILISQSLGDKKTVEKLKEMQLKLKIEKDNITQSPKKVEKKTNNEDLSTTPIRNKIKASPKKRKKLHEIMNSNIKLEIKAENNDITNNIIVSFIYLYIILI